MRLRSLKPSQGIWFAWHPVWTPEGKVWLEHVHFKWIEGWGWGSDGHYEYRRYIDDNRYDRGERAHAGWGERPLQPCTCPDNMIPEHVDACRFADKRPADHSHLVEPAYFDYEVANGRVIPPNVSKCAERNTNDPCRYPQCTCMNIGGSRCPT